MKTNTKEKLHKIADIWNHFIWEYKFCNSKIKFTEDVRTNYFGDILGYFQDTFEIIYNEKTTNLYSDRFAYHISLLQAIYVQQDFVEELLIIFKCDINKDKLKQDENYAINREIRNELVGHPIRKTKIPVDDTNITGNNDSCTISNKTKMKSVLLSSTLFSNYSSDTTIQYIRYHRNNNYQFEIKTFQISDILKRHTDFLNTYLDKILHKLKGILDKYLREIERLEVCIDNQDFETVIKIVELTFESIFKSDYIYDKTLLVKVFKRRQEHDRYQVIIDNFYSDLKKGVIDIKNYVEEIFEPKSFEHSVEPPIFDISFTETSDSVDNIQQDIKVTYHYELGKLASKRNIQDFDFFSKLLINKCSNNNLVIAELEHMRENIYDEIEYYSAYSLICKELNE
jgi:hypothetical protein